MHVIGTAGHIDHGKTTLIHRLTGMNPDRLKEEQERGLTIDLGFAWMRLPSGIEAGIVDVPGHHRFVRNMLAGAGGIDLTLFVVAANEGWMPQSEEHLAILDLLGVERGIFVLTKMDAVEDEEWLDLVEEEVRARIERVSLRGSEIVRVSAQTGEGIDELVAKIDEMLAQVPPRPDLGRPRLWIDRVFAVRGAGTVVTGTLEGGAFAVDDALALHPAGVQARVRGLQTFQREVERALPGSRAAVNLAGLPDEGPERGDALTGLDEPVSDVMHAFVRVLEGAEHLLPRQCELSLHVGTAEIRSRLLLLDAESLAPGEEGLAQIRLERRLPLRFKDRFVLREPGRQETLGGGLVLDIDPPVVRGPSLRVIGLAAGRDWRPPEAAAHLDLQPLRDRLEADAQALPAVIAAQRGCVRREEAILQTPLSREAAERAIDGLAGVVSLPSYILTERSWEALSRAVKEQVAAYHRQFPLRRGMPRETARTQVGLPEDLFDEALARWTQSGELAADGAVLRLPSHAAELEGEALEASKRLLETLAEEPLAPPSVEALREQGFDDELINFLVERGDLVKVSRSLVFLPSALDEVKSTVASLIEAHGQVDVAALRDRLGATRKYVVPLLEYLDQQGFTRRLGDVRVLGHQAGA